jgi:hypothetical protein
LHLCNRVWTRRDGREHRMAHLGQPLPQACGNDALVFDEEDPGCAQGGGPFTRWVRRET